MSAPNQPNYPAISPNLSQQLQVLRQAYIERLGEKIDAIETAWQHYLVLDRGETHVDAAYESSQDALALVHRLFHSLAGSGATFGLPEISNSARVAEIILKEAINGERVLDTEDENMVEASYLKLRRAAELGGEAEEIPPVVVPVITPPEAEYREIYIFCEEASTTHVIEGHSSVQEVDGVPQWVLSVGAFGYRVSVFGDPDQLAKVCKEQVPSALIIDCESEPATFVKNSGVLGDTIKNLLDDYDKSIPLLWICKNGDLNSRLQSVQLGGSAFFTQPIDVDSLLVKLDDLTSSNAPEPYRVLIIDDEPALARLFSLVLRQAGMEVCEVINPLEVMKPLVDFRPDLILMDVYMPGCRGTELAAVIRQQEAYLGIPIVFLSVETDLAKQMDAMRRGGDDFLIKPVQPRHLVAAVTARVSRARILRNLMMRDSLTGLLNHTKTKEQLSIEVDRVKRMGHTISVAMIDIDHFKNVNDTYGHATGDRVLKSLSRLLVQRLRQTDVVGRYGGEEFSVIMNGTSVDQGLRVLDDIRESFSQMIHTANGQEFKVTFSAGLAEAPPHSQADNISELADKALYEAKRTGRNKIVVAN